MFCLLQNCPWVRIKLGNFGVGHRLGYTSVEFLDAHATDEASVMSVIGSAAWRSVKLGSEPRPEKG